MDAAEATLTLADRDASLGFGLNLGSRSKLGLFPFASAGRGGDGNVSVCLLLKKLEKRSVTDVVKAGRSTGSGSAFDGVREKVWSGSSMQTKDSTSSFSSRPRSQTENSSDALGARVIDRLFGLPRPDEPERSGDALDNSRLLTLPPLDGLTSTENVLEAGEGKNDLPVLGSKRWTC